MFEQSSEGRALHEPLEITIRRTRERGVILAIANNPRVFISHSHEDRERFVEGFATRLRKVGADVWLDKWEILPGDSLIDKIFEEGIGEANAVIVIISSSSVSSKWVREELNAAVVKRINGISRLIPVIIDECEVPEALQSTVWVRIKDLSKYDREFEDIVQAIFQHRSKPPLGKPPAYTLLDQLDDLTIIDTVVFKLACEKAINSSHFFIGDVDALLIEAQSVEVPEEGFYESLEILDSRYYIQAKKVFDGTNRIRFFHITSFGFEQYARAYVAGYDEVIQSIGLQIINHNQKDTTKISATLNQPLLLVNHVVCSFRDRGWVKVVESSGGDFNFYVLDYSPELKRSLN